MIPFLAALGKKRQHFFLLPRRTGEENTADIAAAHAGNLRQQGMHLPVPQDRFNGICGTRPAFAPFPQGDH